MKLSVLVAAAIAIGAVGWIVSGQDPRVFGIGDGEPPQKPQAGSVADRLNSEVAKDVTHLTAVRARVFDATTRTQVVVVRGRTEALRDITLKAGIKGRIVELNLRAGERVKKGEQIARIEIDDLLARLAEAKALVRQRRLEHAAARKLGKKGFRSETQIAGTAAALDAAKAYVKQVEVQINKTKILAPFDAVVNETFTEIGDYLEPQTAIAHLVDEDPFLVVGQVSEQEVGKLQTGGTGQATIADGTVVHGSIRFIARVGDAETRTFKVELQVDNADNALRDGMSAELRFPIKSVRAHLLTPALLTLNGEGTIGIRAVDREGAVSFLAANVVGADAKGVWVTGLPERVTIITVGNEFVRHGDKVRVLIEKTPNS